jgi:hypothetical protein
MEITKNFEGYYYNDKEKNYEVKKEEFNQLKNIMEKEMNLSNIGDNNNHHHNRNSNFGYEEKNNLPPQKKKSAFDVMIMPKINTKIEKGTIISEGGGGMIEINK